MLENKLGINNEIELAKEEERYRAGEIKKIQRDAGAGVVEKIARLQGESDDDTRS